MHGRECCKTFWDQVEQSIALSPNVRQMAKKANVKTFFFSWPLPSLWNRNIISQWRKLKDTITEIEGTLIIERIDYFEKTTKITLVMFPSSKWLLVGGCIRGDFSNLCKTVQKSIFMTLIIGKERRWDTTVAWFLFHICRHLHHPCPASACPLFPHGGGLMWGTMGLRTLGIITQIHETPFWF